MIPRFLMIGPVHHVLSLDSISDIQDVICPKPTRTIPSLVQGDRSTIRFTRALSPIFALLLSAFTMVQINLV
jgi:hypothetical protein